MGSAEHRPSVMGLDGGDSLLSRTELGNEQDSKHKLHVGCDRISCGFEKVP